jgi:predicted transcriptional regulator of viral defense system
METCKFCGGPRPTSKAMSQGRRVYCLDCAQDVIYLHSQDRYRNASAEERVRIMEEETRKQHERRQKTTRRSSVPAVRTGDDHFR